MERIYVDKYTGKLERTDIYRVRLTLKDGTVIENLEPRRLFPFSQPDMFFTFLDENEKEVAFVRDLSELDEDSVRAMKECFEEYYMVPVITAILDIDERFGALRWKVRTDRGEVSFRIRSRHSDIKPFYGTNRVLIRDSNDNRYEIKDTEALDPRSKRLLFSYL